MMMNDIDDLEKFLRDVETEITLQPLIGEEENQVLRPNGGVTPQEQAALVLNGVTPLTAAVPPPKAVMSPLAQQCTPAAAEKRRARAADKEKKAKLTAAHTLSERKRRGRINERMKALQELIPNASKLDKETMLGEAIEYVKSAELLVKRIQEEYMQEMMGMDPTMVAYPYAMQQVPYYNPLLMAEAAKLVGPMWDPQLITPGLYPFHQVRLPNSDQQFYGGVHMQQNQNL